MIYSLQVVLNFNIYILSLIQLEIWSKLASLLATTIVIYSKKPLRLWWPLPLSFGYYQCDFKLWLQLIPKSLKHEAIKMFDYLYTISDQARERSRTPSIRSNFFSPKSQAYFGYCCQYMTINVLYKGIYLPFHLRESARRNNGG